LSEIEEVLAVAYRTKVESAPPELLGVQAQLTRLAADVEAVRRRLEAVHPALAAARERLARLEAAKTTLVDARTRLQALEAAGPGLERVRTRVRTPSPSLEAARRALDATASGMPPAARDQVRALATELEAIARTLSSSTPVLEALRIRVRALDALEPVLTATREEVRALEALDPAVETARRELRALATELEAPRRALDAAIGLHQQAGGAPVVASEA
jgi:chromosome segregation ATPase